LGVAALAARSLTVQPAVAQSKYPDRPIRLVIPFPPGGGYDAVGRPWAEKMKSVLGTVVVENQGGGGSSLGAAAVARARPDGYTILLGGSSTHITEAILKSRPLYDPLKELEPISNVVVSAFALAIHPAVPARTLREFIDYAKANPGKLSYGHAGVGSLNHLTGELFKSLAGTPDLVLVDVDSASADSSAVIRGFLQKFPIARILAMGSRLDDAYVEMALEAGALGYLDFRVKKSFFLTSSLEANYNSAIKSIEILKDYPAWRPIFLTGIGKSVSLKTKFLKSTRVVLGYDWLHAMHVPATSAFTLKAGYSF